MKGQGREQPINVSNPNLTQLILALLIVSYNLYFWPDLAIGNIVGIYSDLTDSIHYSVCLRDLRTQFISQETLLERLSKYDEIKKYSFCRMCSTDAEA